MSFAISFVPKWKESEPKSIHPKSMWRARARAFTPLLLAQTRLDAFARSLQLSADGSVIWPQKGGGGVRPSSQSFLGQDGGCSVVVGTHGAYESMWAGEWLEAWRCIHSDPDTALYMLCVTEGRMLHERLHLRGVAPSLPVGVVLWWKPTCLAVSGMIWLFSGGPDEPFCLFRVCQTGQRQRPASQNKNVSQFYQLLKLSGD